MSQDIYELKAETRERAGKGSARELRRNGMIPAVIYGDKKSPVSIALSRKEISKKLHQGGFLTTIASIDVGGEKIRVLPKDYQVDPVRDFVLHVDFLRVSAKTKVQVAVPVHFINEDDCPGLRQGGVLNIVRHEVEVNCSANDIPEFLTGDLKGLELNDGLHISAFDLPAGVTPVITDRDFTVATIAQPAGLRSEKDADEEETIETEVINQTDETVSEEDDS
ncbi:50S ribosomal protein L25/general stress protein Ctc [Pseudohoeflea coraliihabitans]|uniref:Large ribosomal subunit protein bL25 n=1 Tax=Pseudohoeflea coraliihabitans TaxID=2860393 RepID=A0ABS6WJI4_9HYPH|nr:50S ribosomal protein L25/general stress protein Ctc [Pseudohoeflea sp. DP4N28-3]MBW3096106.1 50S ribosomal protein L25/general stress protein Ctc [Pseudohoeflea sp. DP4N28-3]